MNFEKPPMPMGEQAPEEERTTKHRRQLDAQSIELSAQSYRQELLEQFRSQEEGLNVERCRDFITSMGLPLKESLVLKEEQKEAFLQALKKMPLSFQRGFSAFEEGEVSGLYNANLDMVVVIRPPENLGMTETEVEGLVVHELAHASSSFSDLLDEVRPTTRARVGLMVTKSPANQDSERVYRGVGSFWEEGYAELMGKKYLRQFRTDEEKRVLLDTVEGLGLKDLRLDDVIPFGFPAADGGFNEPMQTALPLDFMRVKEGGSLTYSNLRAFQAYALQLLCEQIPELEDALRESRTSVKGLRDVGRLIERFEPGLYGELQTVEDFDMKGILEGLNKVRALVENKKKEKETLK